MIKDMNKIRLNQIEVLKEAILHLPQKEKDKLLLRLINKDQMLIKQLHFQLLENEVDLWKRHQELEKHLEYQIQVLHQKCLYKNSFTQYSYLLATLREMSGKINEHASITKSKDSELKLRLKVIRWSIELFPDLYSFDSHQRQTVKYLDYQRGRLKLCLTILSKLHEDLRCEFQDDLRYIYQQLVPIQIFRSLFIEFEEFLPEYYSFR